MEAFERREIVELLRAKGVDTTAPQRFKRMTIGLGTGSTLDRGARWRPREREAVDERRAHSQVGSTFPNREQPPHPAGDSVE
jgi:hypothetical protein